MSQLHWNAAYHTTHANLLSIRSIFDIISAGFLFFGNLWAGQLSDATVAAGMGPVGCFGMGFAACAVSGVMLLAAVAFGGMGRPELVNLGKLAKRGKSAQAS